MLTRTPNPGVRTTLVTTMVAIATIATPAVLPAQAQPGVDCPDGEQVLINEEQVCLPRLAGPVTPDGSPAEFGTPDGAGGGVQTECTRPIGGTPGAGPKTVRCNGPAGWYSYSWDCLFLADNALPAEGMPGYEEHGDDGLVYRALCWSTTTNPYGLQHWYPPADAWGQGDLVVLAEPPDGYGGTPSRIVELWVQAVNDLAMRGPAIVTAPPVDTAGLVHLPVWIWTEVGGSVWPEDEPLVASAEDPALAERVDAYAEPRYIDWDMGDGEDPVHCDTPGVAWSSELDFLNPPADACHHTYRRASRDQPDGVFEIVAITTWRVWWDINGELDNEVEIQVGTSATYRVNELQVLTGQ